ncbi:MAG TPA: cytochrome c biogenesis protein CcsA [Pirellulales bacterium]|nr:cytochrome c biogenesis protein CcsA [Pirellulales bacterium]
MLAGTSIFCFAASYAVALLLEGSRLFFRSGVRGAILLGFGAAGFFDHTIFLVYRASSEPMPLASEFDWYLVAAWLLAAVYLYLTLHFPRTASGLFTLPLILGLVAVAAKFANRQPFAQTKASQFWGTIHGTFVLLGTVAVLVGFVAGLMHLVQSYRLKHKLPAAQGFQLPSLEWLERTNSRATIFSALALAVGFVSGLLLNLVNRSERPGESLPWNDPVISSSGALLAWMVAAALFSIFYRPARQGRKVAYLTVASFLFLAAVLGYQLAAPTVHGEGKEPRQGDKETRGQGDHAHIPLSPCLLVSLSRSFAANVAPTWYVVSNEGCA